MRSRSFRRIGVLVGVVSLVGATLALAQGVAAAKPAPAGAGGTVSYLSLTPTGTRNVAQLSASAHRVKPTQANEHFILGPRNDSLIRGGQTSSGTGTAAPATNFGVAKPAQHNDPATPSPSGFIGITGAIQAAANGAYDLEPPDQGLCTNGTDVVEVVNNAYAVYSPSGAQVLSPVAVSSIFGVPGETTGNFTSDPRCYYDPTTQRWFVTELDINAHNNKSWQLIAVSQGPDPTGNFTGFEIPTTDARDPGCPCFGDYPMIGADANGFYVTTNEFSLKRPNFNGAQLYAMSKSGLESAATGGPTPTVVHFGALASPFPGETVGETYHLSPALNPPGAAFDTSANGTEYFAMSDAFPVSSDLLAAYALTNTASLSSPRPSVALSSTLVTLGQTYQFPETGLAVPQKAFTSTSQVPLASYIAGQTGTMPPEGVLQADFDAVQQVSYVNGQLYAELTSAASPTAPVGTASAQWYEIGASTSSGSLAASLTNEGSVGVSGQSLLYPDLVVNSSGTGDMVFTLTGSSNYPSAAYIAFGSNGPTGNVKVAAAGSGPEDGFTCYAYYVGPGYGGCRWGDYSGGAVAPDGAIWLATEFVPPQSYRDFYTNWGTFVFPASAG